MNTKQKVVIWVMAGVLLVLSVLNRSAEGSYGQFILTVFTPILFIGGLVVYLLRDRKK